MSLLTVLLEGKKENLIDKYKDGIKIDGFENLLGEFIDRDPSDTKKYAEWMVKQLIQTWHWPGYNAQSLVDLIDFIVELITKFHDISSSISDKDIEFFLKSVEESKNRGYHYFRDEYKLDRLKRSPKDINAYPDIWVLQLMNNSVDSRKKVEQEENEAKKDVEKIYEDSRFLILRPFTHQASCYYGANTKWCTTTKNDNSYFRRYSNNGDLIYIIDKEATGHSSLGKMAIHIDSSGNASVFDQQDQQRTVQFMLDRFEPIKDTIEEILKGDDDYKIIKNVSEGKRGANSKSLSANYFDSIDDGYVYLSFDDTEEYLSLFDDDLNEYEVRDYANAVELPYGYDSYYYDSYNFDDDMKEGYPLYSFKTNHLRILKEILKITGSELVNCFRYTTPNVTKEKLQKFIQKGNDEKDFYDLYNLEIKGDNCQDKIGKYLMGLDESFIDDLSSAYSIAQDESMKVGVQKQLIQELCDIYENLGLIRVDEDSCLKKYKIPINRLLELYESDIESNKGKTIHDLIKEYVSSNISFSVDEPHNMAYEYLDNDTFDYHFDDDVERALENLKEKLEESEDYEDLSEYKRIYTYISNKYGFNEDIDIKTSNGNITLKLIKLDPTDNKLQFELMRRGENYGFKKGRAKLSTIESLINNYQLFDPLED